MSSSAARVRVVAAIFTGVAAFGLAACAQPVTGTSTPAATTKPVPTTVVESTIVVAPPETVTVQQAPRPQPQPLTPCQQLYADGYSYDAAYVAWADAGFPANWDADYDGFPCEQSYGDQN
jgi:hypothetical protein